MSFRWLLEYESLKILIQNHSKTYCGYEPWRWCKSAVALFLYRWAEKGSKLGDSLLEMSNPSFWKKKQKNISKCRLLKLLPSMLSIIYNGILTALEEIESKIIVSKSNLYKYACLLCISVMHIYIIWFRSKDDVNFILYLHAFTKKLH